MTHPTDYDVPDPLPKNWLREEIERARARSAQIPKWARPVVTRRRITPIPPAETAQPTEEHP